MRNLKRFLAMTLTMLMVVGCFAMSSSVLAFDDVTSSQKQIDLMTLLGIIQGYDESEFGPDDQVERWHMALWVAKIMTGKTSDAYTNWYNTVNYTAFKDVEVDHFLGSVSYCNDNSVIIGTSATTFEPTNGIMIQDVFTMVCRMLGYGSAAMNAQYPWSYINKAMELGLDVGLADDYNNEAIATREEAAIILYNALFAAKADGTTFAASKFNLTFETIVLTGTSKANMFATGETVGKTLAGQNYVAFNILGKDGNIITAPTYYLLKSDFGFDADNDENLAFGQSYKVVTNNNFESLLYCEAIEPTYLDQTEFDGIKDVASKLVVESLSYYAVSAYTKLYNKQGSKTSDELEAIVYNVNGRDSYTVADSYVMDASLNILDADGKILLYYQPNKQVVTDWKDKYLYKISDGTYINPDQSIWDRAQKVTKLTNSSMQKVTAAGYKSHNLWNNNAYSDNYLYDDNGDGIYDRVFHTYYKFGFLSYNDDAFITVDGTKIFGDVKYTDVTYVDADGNKLAAADVMKAHDSSLAKGNYVLYTYNEFNKYVTVKEIFDPISGLVTTINRPAGTITFDQVYYNISLGNVAGNKYNIGNARLPGATQANVIDRIGGGKLDELHGKNVHFVEKDGNVLAVYEVYKNAGNYIVFDTLVGMNSTGYANALVYNNSNVRTVITIASVDSAWYAYSSTSNLYTNLSGLSAAHGHLFSSTTDALGNYHIKFLNPSTDYTYYYNRAMTNKTYKSLQLKFTNGIAYPVIDGKAVDGINEYKFLENANGVAKAFTQFRCDANTVIVVLANNKLTDADQIKAYKGIPTSGAYISIFEDAWTNAAEIFVVASDDPLTADFIYVRMGDFKGTVSSSAWNYTANDTIIFVDNDTINTEIQTNQTSTGYGVTLGSIYSYNNAIDFINGGVYNNILVYNQRLVAGKFYRILDGYVQNEVVVGDEIKTGYLQHIDTYEAVWLDSSKSAKATNYKANYLYQLVGTDIVNETDKTTPLNKLNAVKADINAENSFAPVYYYDNTISSARYLDAGTQVFIYKSIDKGTTVDRIGERYSAVSIDDVITSQRRHGRETVLLQALNYQAASGLERFNVYPITLDTYNLISELGYWNNDPYNDVIHIKGVGMELLDSTGARVANFNDDNIIMFTMVTYTNADGYKYFLVLTSKPGFNATDLGNGTSTYTLRWEKGLNTYTLPLKQLGVDAAHLAFTVDNLAMTYGFTDTENEYYRYSKKHKMTWETYIDRYDIETVKLFTNYVNENDVSNLFFNYGSFDIIDLGIKGKFGFSVDALVAWGDQNLYLKTPVVEHEKENFSYEVEVYYIVLDLAQHLTTDGINSFINGKFANYQHWHLDPTIIPAKELTSLHPSEYKVWTTQSGKMDNDHNIVFFAVYKEVDNTPAEPVYAPLHVQLSVRAADAANAAKPQAINLPESYLGGYLGTGDNAAPKSILNAMNAIKIDTTAFSALNEKTFDYDECDADSCNSIYDLAYMYDFVTTNQFLVGSTIKLTLPVIQGFNIYVGGVLYYSNSATTDNSFPISAYANAVTAGDFLTFGTTTDLSGNQVYSFTMPEDGAYVDVVYIPVGTPYAVNDYND